MIKTQTYQAITLVVIVLIVDLLERTRPGFSVTRKRELSLNILSLVVVIVFGELWKESLLSGFGSLHLASVVPVLVPGSAPSLVKVFIGVLLGDLSLYWVHRAMHARPLLWRTHAFHHSIPEIWWLSGSRTSVTHLLLFAVPQILTGYYLIGLTPVEAGVAFSFGVVVNVWIHANIRLDLGPLEWLIITPNYHRIHHGAKGFTGRNLAFVFTIWDRMFGTYADPRRTGKDFPVLAVPTKKRLLRMIVGY